MSKNFKYKFLISGISALLALSSVNTTAFAESYQPYETALNLIQSIKNEKDSDEEKSGVYENIPVSDFEVGNLSPGIDTEFDFTDWWYSEWDDCRYIFLPVTANRKNLQITYSAEDMLYLNGRPVKSGELTSILSESDTFQVRVGKKDCGTLKVMQSNLGCIYLSTTDGGVEALDKDRSAIQGGDILMLNSEGDIEYSGPMEKFSSHGNSSWDYSDKKPYNLKLPKKENLYGMGKGKKWVLLSNYLDHSMLRNKLTEEMCRACGMEFVMDSVFLDLYADGLYRGTYQLYEKIQVNESRVNIDDLEKKTEKLNDLELDEYPHEVSGAESLGEYIENSCKYYDIPNNPKDITGGYLLQFQLWNRYGEKADSGFVTSRGQAISIDGPEYASKEQVEYIRSFVQDMEDAVYSETGYNGKGKHYSEYLDVDSFIVAYLVQEISENVDAGSSSFYFWKDSDLTGDGKIHFSPAWDFDFSYNNFRASRRNSEGKVGYSSLSNNMFAICFPINGYGVSGRPTFGVNWIGQLYNYKEIEARAAKIYLQRFKPFLDNLTGGQTPYLRQLAQDILPSAEMSNARWHTYGGKEYCVFGSSSGEDFMGSVDILREFINKRSNWLAEHWSEYLSVDGDVDDNGITEISDAVLLQKWLLNASDSHIGNTDSADLNKDGKIDIFDMIELKKLLFK